MKVFDAIRVKVRVNDPKDGCIMVDTPKCSAWWKSPYAIGIAVVSIGVI